MRVWMTFLLSTLLRKIPMTFCTPEPFGQVLSCASVEQDHAVIRGINLQEFMGYSYHKIRIQFISIEPSDVVSGCYNSPKLL